MSRAALRKNDEYVDPRLESVDWWGDFEIDTPPQKPKLRVYENPGYARPAYRPVKRKKASHSFMAFAAVILFFSLSIFQISRIAAFSEKGKEVATLKKEIKALEKDNETKELRLAIQENIDRVRDIAINDLGMVEATDEQTIVLNQGGVAAETIEEMAEVPGEEMEAYSAP